MKKGKLEIMTCVFVVFFCAAIGIRSAYGEDYTDRADANDRGNSGLSFEIKYELVPASEVSAQAKNASEEDILIGLGLHRDLEEKFVGVLSDDDLDDLIRAGLSVQVVRENMLKFVWSGGGIKKGNDTARMKIIETAVEDGNTSTAMIQYPSLPVSEPFAISQQGSCETLQITSMGLLDTTVQTTACSQSEELTTSTVTQIPCPQTATGPSNEQPLATPDLSAIMAYPSDDATIPNELTTIAAGDHYYITLKWTVDYAHAYNVRVDLGHDGSWIAYGIAPDADPAYYYYVRTNSYITAVAGEHTAEGYVDRYDTIAETNEGNNYASKSFNVSGGPQSDLVALDVFPCDASWNDITSSIQVGDSFYPCLKWRCDNADAGPFRLEIYHDGSLVVYNNSQIGEAGYTYYTRRTSAMTAEAESHSIRGVLDAYDAVSESNESNNEEYEDPCYTCEELPPDLVALDVFPCDASWNDITSSIQVGDSFHPCLQWRCDNADAGPFRLEIYHDRSLVAYNNNQIGEAGKTYYTRHTSAMTAEAESHSIRGVLDAYDAVSESNESNNEEYEDPCYTCEELPPDLVALDVFPCDASWNDITSSIQVGDSFHPCLQWRCDNADAGPFRLEIYHDGSLVVYNNSQIGEAGHTYYTRRTSAMTAEAGSHSIRGVLDVYDAVSESNESNNEKYEDPCYNAQKPTWILMYYMSNGGNLEDCCEAKFRAIAQEAVNTDFQAYLLWDHLSGEDRVFRMKNNTDWISGYTHNVDYWTATDIGLSSAEMDTGDVNTLNTFIDFILGHEQADHYALIIFNHGGGVHPTVLLGEHGEVITGICFDSSNYLSIYELGQGCAYLDSAIGRNFEILHLDACLMQMIEINHEVRNYCDYVVASENEGWAFNIGTSWETGYLNNITSGTTAESLANSVAAAYFNNISSARTISVLRQSHTSSVSNAVNGLATALINNMRTIRNDLQSARNDAQKFAYYDTSYTMTQSNIFLDLKNFCQEINYHIVNSEVNNAANALVNAIGNEGGNFVISEDHQSGSGSDYNYDFIAGTYGVSIFFPESTSPSGLDVYYNYVNDSATSSNLAFCSATQWDEFLRAYLEWKVLKVSSSGTSNVSITCTTDELGDSDGTTPFVRLYQNNASVSLTAPATAGGIDFVRWNRNGSSYSTSQTFSFFMDSDYDFEAVYYTVSDLEPPDTSITDGPSGTIIYNDVTFTYTGSDDVTPTSNLVYSYKLEGYDSSWSSYSSSTSKSYNDLSNDSYTFYVKAKDQAGNVDPTPASQSFTVSVTEGPTLTLGTERGRPDSTVNVPGYLYENSTVVGCQFDVVFNSNNLESGGSAQPGADLEGTGFSVTSSVVEPGRIRIIISPPFQNPLSTIPNGEIVILPIHIKPDAQESTETLNFENIVGSDEYGNPVYIGYVPGEIFITYIQPGDANGDGSINVMDVICIINVILDTGTASGNPDCNDDGDVNVQDVICVINKILGG